RATRRGLSLGCGRAGPRGPRQSRPAQVRRSPPGLRRRSFPQSLQSGGATLPEGQSMKTRTFFGTVWFAVLVILFGLALPCAAAPDPAEAFATSYRLEAK